MKNRSIGVESDLDSKTPRTQWPGDRGFSQVEILFFLFYIYTIISSNLETAAKKTVAKHKWKPSRTVWKNIKADSQTKSLELEFLFKLLKIEEIYLN